MAIREKSVNYTRKTFSLPVGSNKVTQEMWDAIFGDSSDALAMLRSLAALGKNPRFTFKEADTQLLTALTAF